MQKFKNDINEIGLDEAGRGPLIGRVYAGAVIWPNDKECPLITDSKKLTPKKRQLALKDYGFCCCCNKCQNEL